MLRVTAAFLGAFASSLRLVSDSSFPSQRFFRL
jgi:hypothetical protein